MSKFKGALVGDQHFSDVSPKSRKDDYKLAIFEKLRFVLQYCKDKGINNVFLLGDLFHRKQPNLNSHWLVQSIISLLLEFQPEVTVYTLIGNHDFTTDISVLPRQPIMTVIKSGAIKPLGLDGEPFVFDFGSYQVEVNGKPYSDREDGTEKSSDAYKLKFNLEDSYKIALYHSTLLPDGKSFFGDWINFADVAPVIQADFIGCGHFHPGYEPPVLEAHNKTWCNPGAISRGTAEDHNLTRKLQFVTFLYDGNNLHTKTVGIPHKSGKEVFDVETLKREKEERKEHSEFVDALADPENLNLDISSVEQLCLVAAKLSTDKAAVALAQDFLRRASEGLS